MFRVGERVILAQPETTLLEWRRGQSGTLLTQVDAARWIWKADYDGLVIRCRDVELEPIEEAHDRSE